MKLFYEKGDVQIRTAVYADVQQMKNRIRESDRREVEASHGHTPEEALSYSYTTSCFKATVIYKGDPVAMFGVVKDETEASAGSVWMLATNGIYDMKPQFLRLSRRFIALMQEQFTILYNFVDARNAASIEWLTWCGATISESKTYGTARLPFRFFSFSKEKA
jgi:hypothetical protein